MNKCKKESYVVIIPGSVCQNHLLWILKITNNQVLAQTY